MGLHAFVDESYRNQYILCAVVVDSRDVAQVRQAMTALLRRSQHRVHMAKENNAAKRKILSSISSQPATAYLMTAGLSGHSRRVARSVCLSNLTSQLATLKVDRLVIESCDQDKEDLQVIGDELSLRGTVRTMDINHLRPWEDPLLWMPDAVAWAYGNERGQWRGLVLPIVSRVIRC
jgi:hypothetical protein